jgi:organic radical activating enzyme
MIINQLIDEDFVNYKTPSMYIGFPKCDFKCDRECGMQVCQNSTLAQALTIEVSIKEIVDRYITNDIAKSVVIAGLEPFDTFSQLESFIVGLRDKTDNDIVIYTGYYKEEIKHKIGILKKHINIIVKFGRFIPNQNPHYDELLGVELASDNQYAEKIS